MRVEVARATNKRETGRAVTRKFGRGKKKENEAGKKQKKGA